MFATTTFHVTGINQCLHVAVRNAARGDADTLGNFLQFRWHGMNSDIALDEIQHLALVVCKAACNHERDYMRT